MNMLQIIVLKLSTYFLTTLYTLLFENSSTNFNHRKKIPCYFLFTCLKHFLKACFYISFLLNSRLSVRKNRMSARKPQTIML